MTNNSDTTNKYYDICALWYRPPELLMQYYPTQKSQDIWSLGCVIYEILTHETLFPGDSEIDQIFKIYFYYFHFNFFYIDFGSKFMSYLIDFNYRFA